MTGSGHKPLTDDQVASFHSRGYLRLGRIGEPDELDRITAIYDRIVGSQLLGYPIERYSAWEAKTLDPAITIVSPELIEPALSQTRLAKAAHEIAVQVFRVSPDRVLLGWRIFHKPGNANETPWHQDAIYRLPPYQSMSIWMPLNGATPEQSCLSYIPGSHHGGLMPHREHNMHMVAEHVNDTAVAECPLAVGEATAHHCLTIHRAGPNRTPSARRAITLVCQLKD